MAYDEDLADRIRELIADEPDLSEMRMFGGLAFLIGGNMSVAASGQGGLMVRVDRADAAALLTPPHARPFEMRDRAMQGWLLARASRWRAGDAQSPSTPGSPGTSTACCWSASSGTISSARSWVDASTT